ncbi:unnamed protein product [Pedinophyceae sp. YPF-701]|nr:unnamed protein product [Pedinophyceae sp. YPF-701]
MSGVGAVERCLVGVAGAGLARLMPLGSLARAALAGASRGRSGAAAAVAEGATGRLRAVRAMSDTSGDSALEYDCAIVGAGPAGLAAAIRMAQLGRELGHEHSICVLEKGSEAGAHTISGCVMDPAGLDELLPGWRDSSLPEEALMCPVERERVLLLHPPTSSIQSIPLPVSKDLDSTSSFIVSLSRLTRALAKRAEDLGVDILPGFPAARLLRESPGGGAVRGVVTGDQGLLADGSPGPNHEPGVEVRARATLLAEGCRGSLSEEAIRCFGLRAAAGAHPHSTYGLGLKEVWRLPEDTDVREGQVLHAAGYPAPSDTYGGGFLYTMPGGLVALGVVLGLDYKDPAITVHDLLEQFRAHPVVADIIEDGERIEYGARTLNEGGWQSLPRLAFPGGALLGCAAGTLNVPRLKGVHTAIKSGIVCAEELHIQLAHPQDAPDTPPIDLTGYDRIFRESWAGRELYAARNVRPVFQSGFWAGGVHALLDAALLRKFSWWTFPHRDVEDHACTEPRGPPAAPGEGDVAERTAADGVSDSVYLSGVSHRDGQPCHLRLTEAKTVVEKESWLATGGVEAGVCPAGVYEYVAAGADAPDGQGVHLVINHQNCVHCKACDIKAWRNRVRWECPEGAGGPQYTHM